MLQFIFLLLSYLILACIEKVIEMYAYHTCLHLEK